MALSTTTVVNHDPNEILDYWMDWSNVLAAGETISTSQWVVESGTATLGDSAGDGSPSTTKSGVISSSSTGVWVLTATAGHRVHLRNRIVTSTARQYDRTGMLRVVEA